MKSEAIKLRITPTLKEYIRVKAESQNRTMSSYIISAVKKYLATPHSENLNLPKETETKSAVILIRVTPEFKAEFQEKADMENRTMSNYIITIMQRLYYQDVLQKE